MARNTLPRRTLGRARALRRDQTEAERDLWAVLKGNQVDGFGFRRQAPMGPFYADFVCHSAKLVIELDGSQHGEPDGLARDHRRDRWFAEQGYLVLRFWNNDVFGNLDGVVGRIADELRRRGSPSQPSPARGEGSGDAPSSKAEDPS